MLLTAYGIGFAIERHAPVLAMLRWIGVGYLLFLAWRMWTASGKVQRGGGTGPASFRKIWLQGALISLTNPKVILFIAVVMPQAVTANAPLYPQLLLLGFAATLISLLVHTVYSTLGHFIGQSIPTARARVISNRIIAAVFVAAALGLAFANIG
jgi:threonine/homoserine/homoserine lactone efflux protein